TEAAPYSEVKQRIAAGQVAEVVVGPQQMRAVPIDSLRATGAPDAWTATMPPDGDDELIPLLEERGVQHEFTTAGWFSQMLAWLLPIGLLIVFWIWMLRRMNPQQNAMTVGRNRARIM